MNKEIQDIYLKIGNVLTEGQVVQGQITRKYEELVDKVNELDLTNIHVRFNMNALREKIDNLLSEDPDIGKIMSCLNDCEKVIQAAKEEL